MRDSSNHCEIVATEGVTYGVNLGFDFCAEHEWGFKWAARYLGRPENPSPDLLGVRARTTTQHADDFPIELVEYQDELWLRGQRAWSRDQASLESELSGDPKKVPHYMGSLMRPYGDKPLRAAWDGDSGFCVVGRTDEAKEAIRIAHKALMDDACFIVQSGGVFGAGGLKLIDARLIPDQVDWDMTANDRASFSLEEAVEATGIRQRLEAAGKRYFALSPRWVDQDKGSFQFWLNPMEQQANNFGWFTVADLDDWIAGKGKIPMRAKETAK